MRPGEGLELEMMYFQLWAPSRTLHWLDQSFESMIWICSEMSVWIPSDLNELMTFERLRGFLEALNRTEPLILLIDWAGLLSGGRCSRVPGQSWAYQMPCSSFWPVGAHACCLIVVAARATSPDLTCPLNDDPSKWIKSVDLVASTFMCGNAKHLTDFKIIGTVWRYAHLLYLVHVLHVIYLNLRSP